MTVDSREIRCPVCSSTRARIIPRRERGDVLFTIRRPCECDVCGARFAPPSRLGTRLAAVAIMAFFAGLVAWGSVLPNLLRFAAGRLSVFAIVDFSLASVAVCFFVWAAYMASRSGRYLILSTPADQA